MLEMDYNDSGKPQFMEVISLNASHSNTDRCNIAGETSDMHVEESLNVSHSNTDWCNIAGETSDMHSKESLIELREINEDNYQQCCGLKATVENESFVDSVAYSLAEAWVFYKDTKPFAIYDSDKMIGFVSMYVGERNYQIVNFLIDDVYRHKGLGTKAAKVCIRYLQREYNADRVSVPVDLENKLAQNFWKKLGFIFSDNVEEGYVFMRLYLS